MFHKILGCNQTKIEKSLDSFCYMEIISFPVLGLFKPNKKGPHKNEALLSQGFTRSETLTITKMTYFPALKFFTPSSKNLRKTLGSESYEAEPLKTFSSWSRIT